MVWQTDKFKDSEEFDLFIHAPVEIRQHFKLDSNGFPFHGDVQEIAGKLYWIKIRSMSDHNIAYIYRKKEGF